MLSRSRKLLFFALIFVLPVLAACAGPSGPTIINVDAGASDGYQMLLDKSSAPPGTVTFKITNNSTTLIHEFVVLKTDLAADEMPLTAENDMDEEFLLANLVGEEVEDIQSGATAELTVELVAGHYVLVCNLPGHYDQGMRADFTVK